MSESSPKVTIGNLDPFTVVIPVNWIGSTSKEKTTVGISKFMNSKLQQVMSMDRSPSFLLSQQVFGWKKDVSVWLKTLQVCLWIAKPKEPNRILSDNKSESKILNMSSIVPINLHLIKIANVIKIG